MRGEDHPYFRPIALEIMAALAHPALSPSSDQFYAMMADDKIGLSGGLCSRHHASSFSGNLFRVHMSESPNDVVSANGL